MIHYTGNNGDTAKGNCEYFLRKLPSGKEASANYFVDEISIWQSVEDENVAWHCGGASVYYTDCRNSNSIGIELCSRLDLNTKKYYFLDETVKNAQMLTAYLMEKYDITSDHILRHYDVNNIRKICPAPFVQDISKWYSFKDGISWVDNIIYLKKQGRLTSANRWVLKNYEQDPEIKYLITKWANDVKTLTNNK